jgi:acetyl-CoA carboxylase alpha subunit
MDPEAAAVALRGTLREALKEFSGMTPAAIIEQRYEKFRQMGNFFSEAHL